MKRVLSFILACTVALGLLASLGGCGSSATLYTGKKGFVENQTYFTELSDAFTKPVMALDSKKLEKLMESEKLKGMKFDLTLDEIKGLDDLLSSVTGGVATGQASTLSTILDALPVGIGGAISAEGEGAAAALSLIFDGKPVTLNAKLDSEGIALALPGLLSKVAKISYDQLDMPMEDLLEEAGALQIDPASFEKLWDVFVGAFSDSLFKDTAGTLPTADGDAEYKAIALEIDGNDIIDALASAAKELTEGNEFDTLLEKVAYLSGATLEEIKKTITDAVAQLDGGQTVPNAEKLSLSWTRFTDSEKICADKLTVDFDGEGVTLFMGITESKSGEYGFMKLTDSSDTDLMKIDSSITDEECELTVKVNADGESVKLSFNGKKDVVDGTPATVSTVGFGSGGMTMNLFTLTTTVNELSDDMLDVSGKLELALPTGSMMGLGANGEDVGATLSFNVAVGDISAASDAFGGEEISFDQLEDMSEQLLLEALDKLEASNPKLQAILSLLVLGGAMPENALDSLLSPDASPSIDSGSFTGSLF